MRVFWCEREERATTSITLPSQRAKHANSNFHALLSRCSFQKQAIEHSGVQMTPYGGLLTGKLVPCFAQNKGHTRTNARLRAESIDISANHAPVFALPAATLGASGCSEGAFPLIRPPSLAEQQKIVGATKGANNGTHRSTPPTPHVHAAYGRASLCFSIKERASAAAASPRCSLLFHPFTLHCLLLTLTYRDSPPVAVAVDPMALRHVMRRGCGVMTSSAVNQTARGGAGPSLKDSKVWLVWVLAT